MLSKHRGLKGPGVDCRRGSCMRLGGKAKCTIGAKPLASVRGFLHYLSCNGSPLLVEVTATNLLLSSRFCFQ